MYRLCDDVQPGVPVRGSHRWSSRSPYRAQGVTPWVRRPASRLRASALARRLCRKRQWWHRPWSHGTGARLSSLSSHVSRATKVQAAPAVPADSSTLCTRQLTSGVCRDDIGAAHSCTRLRSSTPHWVITAVVFDVAWSCAWSCVRAEISAVVGSPGRAAGTGVSVG